MATNKIEISKYTAFDRIELLRLLLELHLTYFFQNASPQIPELQQEKDLQKSYESYLDFIYKMKDGTWLTLLAKPATNNVVGFIIGGIETDNSLVLSKAGKLKDRFGEQQFRGQGIGMKFCNQLEKWFIEKVVNKFIPTHGKEMN